VARKAGAVRKRHVLAPHEGGTIASPALDTGIGGNEPRRHPVLAERTLRGLAVNRDRRSGMDLRPRNRATNDAGAGGGHLARLPSVFNAAALSAQHAPARDEGLDLIMSK